MSECRSEKKVLGVGDIANMLRKLEKLENKNVLTKGEFSFIRNIILENM